MSLFFGELILLFFGNVLSKLGILGDFIGEKFAFLFSKAPFKKVDNHGEGEENAPRDSEFLGDNLIQIGP